MFQGVYYTISQLIGVHEGEMFFYIVFFKCYVFLMIGLFINTASYSLCVLMLLLSLKRLKALGCWWSSLIRLDSNI